jgi:hypothetical protein
LMDPFYSCTNDIYEALHHQARIHQLPEPDRFDIRDIQNFMSCDEMALPLTGRDRYTYGSFLNLDSYCKDSLVTLRARARTDAFSSKLSEHAITVMDFFKRVFTKRRNDPSVNQVTEGYHDTTVSKVTSWLTSVIASAIPVFSIIALVNIPTLKRRLAAIAGFNVCLVFFTEVRRIDVFSITAAYVCPRALLRHS